VRRLLKLIAASVCVSCFCSTVQVARSATAQPDASAPSETATSPANSEPSKGFPVEIIDPHLSSPDAQEVVETLKKIYEAYGNGDADGCAQYFSEGCTTFDEGTKKLISGKAKVVDHLKAVIAENGPGSKAPILSYVIDQPYAKVNGNIATVSFIARRKIGGAHPALWESRCIDVFVRDDGTWRKLHYRSHWKRIKGN
jgi:hypothetical protein